MPYTIGLSLPWIFSKVTSKFPGKSTADAND